MSRGSLARRLQELLPEELLDAVPTDFVDGQDSLLQRLLSSNVIDAAQVQAFLSREIGLPLQGTTQADKPWPPDVPDVVSEDATALPVGTEDDQFAFVWPHDIELTDNLSFRLGCPIDKTVLSHADFQAHRLEHSGDDVSIVANLFGEEDETGGNVELLPSYDLLEDKADDTDEAPVIRLLNHVILQAYRDNASDIHIEPEEKVSRVRYRVDGMLREVLRPPKRIHNALISRIKIMSELDIAEKRAPQDGRMKLRIGDNRIDIRVSTLPNVFGEKVVMRILNSAALMELEDLGFSEQDDKKFRSIVSRSHGIILVTGPTGSGKTTTLYSTLKFLNSKSKNIITIEDPVEYEMENINQIQVNRRAGIDFASGLKSILRQDPDIIMIGEMRDDETASIAVKAALTGHLVLSTLHTNDAPGSYARLCDMNVAPYLLASSVAGVIAQRLVRQICGECKTPYTPDPHDLELIGLNPDDGHEYVHGAGCDRCGGTGFRGRSGLYEILTPTAEVKKMILAGTLEEGCEIPGFQRMVDDGRAKVLSGVTTASEVCQVVRKQ